ncbi:MAG TPA: T9SS type A sorting domain-containing protein [Flavipsychrobacter sp.]|nr:T9SS type A sorting domain-containing protein [Flavipsychrobacter sp.]
MTFKNYLLIFLSFLSYSSFAQYNTVQNRKWAVGDFYGLDFSNPSGPVVFPTAMDNAEGEASICDGNGDLLFYTNGNTVWNKNGTAMPNGTNLTGTGTTATLSTTQGALIVPMPDSAHKYYLFSLTAVSNCKLFCNVIDMNLDGGLGNVETGFPLRLVALRSGLTEKMTAVPGNNNDVWVMVHVENTDSFLAYHVTPIGLDLVPTGSKIGSFPVNVYQQGVIKFSPDRNKMLNCNFRATNPTAAGLEVFDFDPATGLLSNAVTLDNNSYYGGTFSPDNGKVYAETTNTLNAGTVFQYDLSSSVPAATKMPLGPCGQYTDLKLGPDGKVYFGALVSSAGYSNYKYLGRINHPNLAGALCNFQDSVTSLVFPHPTNASLGRIQQGLPNDIAIPVANPLAIKLTKFTAVAKDLDAYIEWQIAGEKDIDHYVVERSTDGRNYINIQSVEAGRTFYSIGDKNILDKALHLYYRLKMVEQNGNITMSAAIHLFGKNHEAGEMLIYPNPVNDVLHIRRGVVAQITISDITGKIVTVVYDKDQVNVSELPSGMYQLQAIGADGSVASAKFTKAK